MAAHQALEPVAMFLFQCLRHKPEDRGAVPNLRKDLKRLAKQIHARKWPIAPP